MTNEEIKKSLEKLYPCKENFTVTQTGKQSNKVNGLYNPGTKEIFLHNKNFKSDNQLMYTAIHEFTHHVLTTEQEVKTTRSHSGKFLSQFYDFIDIAIKNGSYTRERDEETKALIESAKQLQKELLETQKKLGNLILKIHEKCDEKGDRYEDVIESDLQLSRNKAKELTSMAVKNTDFSDEMTKTIATAKDVLLAKSAAEEGKTVEQVKAVAKKTTATDDGTDDPQRLIKEKKRLERTIEQLNDRLVQVEETLNSITGGSYD